MLLLGDTVLEKVNEQFLSPSREQHRETGTASTLPRVT